MAKEGYTKIHNEILEALAKTKLTGYEVRYIITPPRYSLYFCIEDIYHYALNLEKQWQNSLPRFTDKELLEIFPEAKQFISKEIKEQEQKRTKLLNIIKKKLTLIKYRVKDEFSQWFWREWVKVNEVQKLLEIERNIIRLKRFLLSSKNKVKTGRITEEQKQRALNVPILDIISKALTLQKVGKYYKALCPFHQERNPSFFVYPETNSFWCFGCNQGGNVINFVRLFYNHSFKEAVKYLIGEK